MGDILERIWTHLLGRISGPMWLRLVLQPGMATLFAIRDGLRDARAGQPPYLVRVFTRPEERWRLIREGGNSISKVFIMAILMDAIYQLAVFRWIYPVETLDVAAILAVIPYMLVRGAVDRVARRLKGP